MVYDEFGSITMADECKEVPSSEGFEYKLSDFKSMYDPNKSCKSLIDLDDDSTMASSMSTFKEIKRFSHFNQKAEIDEDFAGVAMEAAVSASSMVADWVEDCSGGQKKQSENPIAPSRHQPKAQCTTKTDDLLHVQMLTGIVTKHILLSLGYKLPSNAEIDKTCVRCTLPRKFVTDSENGECQVCSSVAAATRVNPSFEMDYNICRERSEPNTFSEKNSNHENPISFHSEVYDREGDRDSEFSPSIRNIGIHDIEEENGLFDGSNHPLFDTDKGRISPNLLPDQLLEKLDDDINGKVDMGGLWSEEQFYSDRDVMYDKLGTCEASIKQDNTASWKDWDGCNPSFYSDTHKYDSFVPISFDNSLENTSEKKQNFIRRKNEEKQSFKNKNEAQHQQCKRKDELLKRLIVKCLSRNQQTLRKKELLNAQPKLHSTNTKDWQLVDMGKTRPTFQDSAQISTELHKNRSKSSGSSRKYFLQHPLEPNVPTGNRDSESIIDPPVQDARNVDDERENESIRDPPDEDEADFKWHKHRNQTRSIINDRCILNTSEALHISSRKFGLSGMEQRSKNLSQPNLSIKFSENVGRLSKTKKKSDGRTFSSDGTIEPTSFTSSLAKNTYDSPSRSERIKLITKEKQKKQSTKQTHHSHDFQRSHHVSSSAHLRRRHYKDLLAQNSSRSVSSSRLQRSTLE